MKTVLITGCASGFGYLTALKFARNGWQVIATVRAFDQRSDKLAELANKENLPLEIFELDVSSDQNVTEQMTKICTKYPKIDTLINNAGFGIMSSIEDISIEEVRKIYEVNVYGVVRMIKAMLPHMRANGGGHIINLSSVSGLVPVSFYSIYSSTKFAIESLSESLNLEVAPFNIKVTLIEPGVFGTDFYKNLKYAEKFKSADSAYAARAQGSQENSLQLLLQNDFIKKLADPQKVADKIYKVANKSNPGLRYKVGLDSHLSVFFRRILPYPIWKSIQRRIYNW